MVMAGEGNDLQNSISSGGNVKRPGGIGDFSGENVAYPEERRFPVEEMRKDLDQTRFPVEEM